MTELPTSPATGPRPRLIASWHPSTSRMSWRRFQGLRASAPPARPTTSSTGVDDGPGRTRAEAAFESWLGSVEKPEVWRLDPRDESHTPLTGILGELILSPRQLSADAAAQLGMPHGISQGHAARELLLAVNDTLGPCCRSYRSAVYHLRENDGAYVDR